ncbi:MAG: hypothetical protein WD042_03245 [Phycisphaeraceae bacterium]
MDSRTLQFVIFVVFGLLSLGAGYLCRRRGWLGEAASRRIHFHTVAWIWSAVSLLSLWNRPLLLGDTSLLAMQLIIVVAAGYGVIPLARRMGCNRPQVGVMAIASAQGNIGFTLGAYLCYCLLNPAQEALALGIAYVNVMQVAVIVLIYPLAHHYGTLDKQERSLGHLILFNLLDLRAMLLYAAVLGQILGTQGVPLHPAVFDYHLIDVLFYLGAMGGYFGIGLQLWLGDTFEHLREHGVLAFMKFAFIPLLTIALIALLGQTPWSLSPLAQQVAIVQGLMPTAIATVMLANIFHLDARLASVTWLCNSMLFFVVVLPPILWWWS